MPLEQIEKKSAQESLRAKAEADNKDISQVRSEKLFWETVAENIKESDFRSIYEMIHLDIENRNYILARQVLNEELKKIIFKISLSIYENKDKRGTALLALKEEFFKLFPEIESLMEKTEEERRVKIKIPAGQLEEDEAPPPLVEEGEFREELRNPYLVKERTWEVPYLKELIPGLVINLWDKIENRNETIELIDFPKKTQDGNTSVKIKWNDSFGMIYLADFGLAAFPNGTWNSRYIPKEWGMKNKNK